MSVRWRAERCVCGGEIRSPSLEEAQPHVAAHNASPLHIAWRRRRSAVARTRAYKLRLWADVMEIRLSRRGAGL